MTGAKRSENENGMSYVMDVMSSVLCVDMDSGISGNTAIYTL